MKKKLITFLIFIISFARSYAQNPGLIQGQVIDATTKGPLAGTNIFIVGTAKGTTSDLNGKYALAHLDTGKYTVQFNYVGYESRRLENIAINQNHHTVNLDVELMESPIPLSEITVTPSRFAIMGSETVTRQTLTRQDIQTIPQIGEDIYRAITRLPGISGNDYSAKFTVRGGENEEILVLMDGLELYEPFHLKDINGGVLSIIDVAAIDGVELLTGGFPAEYGDRTSGVFNIASARAPQGKKRMALGASFMNARFMMEGSTERASWLFSARRGYLDLIFKLMQEEHMPSPIYYDALGRYEYQLNDRQTISVNLLTSYDRMNFIEDDEDESHNSYGNSYGWITLKSILTPKIVMQNLISRGRVTRDREGIAYLGGTKESEQDFTVADERKFNVFGFKQDWNFQVSDDYYMKWGFDLKKLSADYDYFSGKKRFYWDAQQNRRVAKIDTNLINFNAGGEKAGAYLTNRFKLLPPLTLELGLRYDYASYTDDKLFSPRVNVAYALGKKTSLRAGWGYFYQSEGMNELNIQDGDTQFDPAELAKHNVIGVEHYFENGLQLRFEGYYKKYSDLRPEYRNWLNQIELFQELQNDRIKVKLDDAMVKGVEFYLKRDTGGKLSWWASYALSYATDNLYSISEAGNEIRMTGKFPGKYDQRHTVYLDMNYRPNAKWHLNLAWQYHTGWPFTEKKMGIGTAANGTTYAYEYVDKIYGTNYPSFHRLDLRLNRIFRTSRGTISTFLELINLYNHKNVRTYETWIAGDGRGNYYQQQETQYWFKLLPSLGISWSWER